MQGKLALVAGMVASGLVQACEPEGLIAWRADREIRIPDPACAADERAWDQWCVDGRCFDSVYAALAEIEPAVPALGPGDDEPRYHYRYRDAFGNRVACIGSSAGARCFREP